jgi:hypothetical protein
MIVSRLNSRRWVAESVPRRQRLWGTRLLSLQEDVRLAHRLCQANGVVISGVSCQTKRISVMEMLMLATASFVAVCS